MKEPITQEGYDLLLREFKYLKEIEKPAVTQEKRIAAELGDRSENAEYHAAKEKLRHIDKRLFYLSSMIEKSIIINPEELTHDRVHFGATVTVCDTQSEEESRYTICGTLESEIENNLISVHSPMAKALLGKEEGDVVRIKLPSGVKEYAITAIEYIPLFSLKKTIRDEKDFTFR